MSKLSSPAFLVMLFGASPALAQVKLEWQFKVGDTFFAERVYTQKQSVEIKGKVFKELRTKTWLSAVTVKEKNKTGHVLELKVESASFTPATPPLQGGDGGVRPAASRPVQGLDDQLAAKIKGCTFRVTVTGQGKVSKFEGYDAFIQKLAEKNAEVEKVLRALLSEEGLREDVDEMFNFLPEKSVRKGDKWKKETVEPVPPFGSFKSVCEYVLEDDKGADFGIGLTIKMSYRPPANEAELFKVVKGSVKGEDGKGTIVFDVNAGRLISSTKSVLLRGEVVLESMGRQTKMEFTSDNHLRVRMFSK